MQRVFALSMSVLLVLLLLRRGALLLLLLVVGGVGVVEALQEALHALELLSDARP